MNNNSGIKVLLVILIVVCLFQSCGLADLSDQVESLNAQLQNMEHDINNLDFRLDDVEDMLENGGMQMNAFYTVSAIDWNAGKINVDFDVEMFDATENTRVQIGTGNERVELTRSGNHFTGTVTYPIDDIEYPAVVYKYEGDYEVQNKQVDWMSAGILMGKNILCEFEGLSSYGNGKLTLAGEVIYGLNTEEAITSAKLVFADEEIALQNTLKGEAKINLSKPVTVDGTIEKAEKCFYVELVLESGLKYQIYPQLYAHLNHKVEVDEEGDFLKDKMSLYQEYHLEVTTPDGKTYNIAL